MFVHLHCHSHYSFLRGVPRPEEIVAAAAEQKMAAVALTDTNGLYAAVPFYQAARAAGVKPLVGAVVDVGAQQAAPAGATLRPGSGQSSRAPTTLLLLAENLEGYSNLCRLATRRQLEEQPLSLEALHAHREGLLALYAPGSEPLDRRGTALVTCHSSLVTALRDLFADALYFEVQHLSPGDGRRLREAARLGRALGVPLAATNGVHFLRPEEHLHHRVLNAVRTGALLTKVAPPEITTPEAYFKSADEMRRAFPDHPEALAATLAVAERANLELPLGRTLFPEFPVPAGETPFSYLWKLCFEGARRRYRPPTPEVLARLTHELGVIEKLRLAPYFLLVWDIAEEARRRGIPAVARGSAASSMVSYCLGLSRICPLRWGLYFERFLNEQRGDLPDIDLDICGARRDDLLDYVYKRWGAERVAMIASFVTMHARLAVREVAKTFGLSPAEVNRFTRRLPHRPVREILEAIRTLPHCRELPAGEEPWKTILDVARRLDGFPRHLGIHPCGTVIAARPLTEWVPLEWATKGIVVTQYDMNAVEALGLIKMDLLGQRGLTTMSLALDRIERATRARVDFDAIPEGDPAACAMIARGRTMGVFQIESPGMRGLLRALGARRPEGQPFRLEDISLALALIRPGAAEFGSKEAFLKRLRGQEPVRYPHPSLAPILGETLGVCVYQEQVMQIAQAVGALSLAEADVVRRSSAKFTDRRERERLRAKFLKAAARLGLEGARREQAWQMVEKFAGFGFCKAHAATYADLAYRMAYLKAHYPAEFLAAMASSGAGFYHVSAYVEEAKRWGIEVRLPSVNRSSAEYTTEPPRAIRIGLMQVKGLRAETMARIVRAREEGGPFRSLEDFLRRVPVERDEIEALIKCGAFDDVGEPSAAVSEDGEGQAGRPVPQTRPALLWRLNLALRAGPAAPPAAKELFPDFGAPGSGPPLPPLADYTRARRLACEQEILEVCVSGHPLDRVARNGESWSTELDRRAGQRVTLLGWWITYRHVGTKNYRNMMFLTLEDQRGVFEAVLFPDASDRYAGLIYETRTLRVTGRVEPGGQINCEKLERVNSDPSAAFAAGE
jgi:DNA-directed DNA polymerase III PolC